MGPFPHGLDSGVCWTGWNHGKTNFLEINHHLLVWLIRSFFFFFFFGVGGGEMAWRIAASGFEQGCISFAFQICLEIMSRENPPSEHGATWWGWKNLVHGQGFAGGEHYQTRYVKGKGR